MNNDERKRLNKLIKKLIVDNSNIPSEKVLLSIQPLSIKQLDEIGYPRCMFYLKETEIEKFSYPTLKLRKIDDDTIEKSYLYTSEFDVTIELYDNINETTNFNQLSRFFRSEERVERQIKAFTLNEVNYPNIRLYNFINVQNADLYDTSYPQKRSILVGKMQCEFIEIELEDRHKNLIFEPTINN